MSTLHNESQEANFLEFIERFESVVESATKASDAIRTTLTQEQVKVIPTLKQEKNPICTRSELLLSCEGETPQRAPRLLLSKDPQRYKSTSEIKIQDRTPDSKSQSCIKMHVPSVRIPLSAISSKDLALRLMWDHARIEQELKRIRNTSQKLVHEELYRSSETSSEHSGPPQPHVGSDLPQSIEQVSHSNLACVTEAPTEGPVHKPNSVESRTPFFSPPTANRPFSPRHMFADRFNTPESAVSIVSPASLASRTSPQNPLNSQVNSPENILTPQSVNPGNIDEAVEQGPTFSLDDSGTQMEPSNAQQSPKKEVGIHCRSTIDSACQTSPIISPSEEPVAHEYLNTLSISASSDDVLSIRPSNTSTHPKDSAPTVFFASKNMDDTCPMSLPTSNESIAHSSQALSFSESSESVLSERVLSDRPPTLTSSLSEDAFLIHNTDATTCQDLALHSSFRPLDASFLSELGELDVSKPLPVPEVPLSAAKVAPSPHRIRRCAQILWSRERRNSMLSYSSSTDESGSCSEEEALTQTASGDGSKTALQQEDNENNESFVSQILLANAKGENIDSSTRSNSSTLSFIIDALEMSRNGDDSFEYNLRLDGATASYVERDLVQRLPDVHTSFWPVPKSEMPKYLSIEEGMASLNVTLPDMDEDFRKAICVQDGGHAVAGSTISIPLDDTSVSIGSCNAIELKENAANSLSIDIVASKNIELEATPEPEPEPVSTLAPESRQDETNMLDESKEMTVLVQILRNASSVPCNKINPYAFYNAPAPTITDKGIVPAASSMGTSDPEMDALEEAMFVSRLLNNLPTRTSTAANSATVLPSTLPITTPSMPANAASSPAVAHVHGASSPVETSSLPDMSTPTTTIPTTSIATSNSTFNCLHSRPPIPLPSTLPSAPSAPSTPHMRSHTSAIYTDSWIRPDSTPGDMSLAYASTQTTTPSKSVNDYVHDRTETGTHVHTPSHNQENAWVSLHSISNHVSATTMDLHEDSLLSLHELFIGYIPTDEIQSKITQVEISRPPWKPSGKVPTEFAK